MPPRRSKKNGDLFLPELVAQEPGAWDINEVEIRESAVNLKERVAFVPRAYTKAQRLARLHELGHVKYSPANWGHAVGEVLAAGAGRGEEIDPTTALRILKMLEENRIDWKLWDDHGIDLRPCREVMDWDQMAAPTEPLTALHWTLQLAWTAWASRGLPAVENAPPARPLDEATGRFFDACWAVISNHHPDLAISVVRACMAMYRDPTDATRNRLAAELAAFFPPPPPKPEDPPEKPEEKAEQQEAKEQEQAIEAQREEEEAPAVGSDTQKHGHFEVHDHTLGVRRPSVRVARRTVPQQYGTRLAFPQRYLLDRSVFGRRVLTEGGLMIDGSGSMRWSREDLERVMAVVPAVWVGYYSGFDHPTDADILGRICILAKGGRFARFDGPDEGGNKMNDIDIEALELLARWPRPRFWLSDGFVAGGKHRGPYPGLAVQTNYLALHGKIVHEADRLLRRHDILRVATVDDLHRLFSRQRVTLYRTCANLTNFEGSRDPARRANYFPPDWQESPVTYQL